MAELPIILEALQTCEAEVEELERLTAQLPKDIEGALERAAAARAAVEAEEQKLEQADHERRAHEAEMQDCEAKRAKYQGQTALVKTNTEYTALLSEIDVMTRRISELEEQILLGMEVIDEVSGRLTTFRVEKQREERELIGSADELKRKLGESEAELEAHEKEREHLVSELPAPASSIYQRLRKAGRTGTTRFRERVCAACHRDIPYETINRVIAGELHGCPYCQRILVAPAA